MLDRARLDQMEESGAAAAMKYRAELEKAVQAVKNDTSHAAKAYFDNVKEKRQAISKRVEALRAECKDLEEEVSSFGPKLARATISGDGSALESIQREIAEWRPIKPQRPHRSTCCLRCMSQGMRTFTERRASLL